MDTWMRGREEANGKNVAVASLCSLSGRVSETVDRPGRMVGEPGVKGTACGGSTPLDRSRTRNEDPILGLAVYPPLHKHPGASDSVAFR